MSVCVCVCGGCVSGCVGVVGVSFVYVRTCEHNIVCNACEEIKRGLG